MKLFTRILLLTLSLALVFGAALSALTLRRAFLDNLSRELERGVQNSGALAASLLSGINAYAALRDGDAAPRAARISAQYLEPGAHFALVDAQGVLVFDNFDGQTAGVMDRMPEAAGQYRLVRLPGGTFQALKRDVSTLQGDYRLLYAQRLDRVYRQMEEQTRGAVLLLVLLCLALGALLFAGLKASFRPLRLLGKAAGDIARGDFSACAPVIRPEDEVGRLALRFNDMAQATQAHVARLMEQDQAQKRFIADMAHELKTPLTSIIGYADLLRRHELDEERRARALDAIARQGERLERMGFKLLYLARLEGGQAPALLDCDAGELLEEAALAFRGLAEEQGVSLLADAQPARWRCDRDLMLALAQNLLSNALKASAPGQRVTLRARQAFLEVEDEGEGIPPEHLPHVREAFYTADRSRSRQGAGLGLALCERIALLHGARMDIDSAPGRGTRVRVTFTGP